MVQNRYSLKMEEEGTEICEMTLGINHTLGIPENYKEVICD